MNDIIAPAPIGHNNPPSEAEIFGEKMKELYADTLSFAERLLAAEERLPAEVKDDVDSGKLGDLIKQLKSCDKSLNSIRTEEKEVYLKGSRMVDGFFNSYREKLEKIVGKAGAVQAAYLKRKEDEERRRREEEAEAKRQEMEAKLREEKRLREEAEAKRREAEEIEAKARAEAARREAEIKAKADAERAAQQKVIDDMKTAAAAQEKADAETKRQLREAEEKLKQVERDAKTAMKEVKAETAAAEDLAHELNKQAKADDREGNKALDSALRADKQAEKLDKLAGSSAADLARTRGMEGSLSTVQTMWVGTVTDRAQIDIVALLPHLRDDDIQIALNSWVKANPGKQMRGAFVREENKVMVR